MKEDKAYSLLMDSREIQIYCHMTDIPGCGSGGWTLAMKLDGSKVLCFTCQSDAYYTYSCVHSVFVFQCLLLLLSVVGNLYFVILGNSVLKDKTNYKTIGRCITVLKWAIYIYIS